MEHENTPAPAYRTSVDPKLMKELIQCSDWLGLLHLGTYFCILVALGGGAYSLLGEAGFYPVFLLYAIVFSFAEAAAHELNHGTVFRSKWLNTSAHWLVCFMSWREQIYSKYRHLRHHSHTSVLGMDPEGEAVRPKSIAVMVFEMLTRFFHAKTHLGAMLRHAFGTVTESDQRIVPKGLVPRMKVQSRIFVLGYLMVFAISMLYQTWLPIVFLIVPRSIGSFVHDLCSRTQHTALAVNGSDYRRTTRTIHLGPVLRFFYWNMNYHIEHHMYQNVPFHALPRLHEVVKPELPPTPRSLLEAWREIFPALWKQRTDPAYVLQPVFPLQPLGHECFLLVQQSQQP